MHSAALAALLSLSPLLTLSLSRLLALVAAKAKFTPLSSLLLHSGQPGKVLLQLLLLLLLLLHLLLHSAPTTTTASTAALPLPSTAPASCLPWRRHWLSFRYRRQFGKRANEVSK